jgi:hypothetical protein
MSNSACRVLARAGVAAVLSRIKVDGGESQFLSRTRWAKTGLPAGSDQSR